jgi:hypothetical protein
MPADVIPLRPPGAAAQVFFDYDALEPDSAKLAQDAADRIRDRLKRDYLATGHDLNRVKERLGHGRFGAWLAAEFGMTARTAERYMSAARFEIDKSDIVSLLLPETIRTLSAPSLPAIVRDGLCERAKRGERLLPKDITEAAVKFRQRQKQAAAEACEHREETKRAEKLGPLARRVAGAIGKNDLIALLDAFDNRDDEKTFLRLFREISNGGAS